MELGESIADCAVREVHEATGLKVEATGIVDIYSDPKHVFECDDGEVRREFSISSNSGHPIRIALLAT